MSYVEELERDIAAEELVSVAHIECIQCRAEGCTGCPSYWCDLPRLVEHAGEHMCPGCVGAFEALTDNAQGTATWRCAMTRTFARTTVDGATVLVSYDAFGYWNASAPGNGASNFGPQTAAFRDMTIRDALSRWREAGRPSGGHEIIPPGWTEVSLDDLVATPDGQDVGKVRP